MKCPKCGNKKHFNFQVYVDRGMGVDLSEPFDLEAREDDFFTSMGEDQPMLRLSSQYIECDGLDYTCGYVGALKDFGGRWPKKLTDALDCEPVEGWLGRQRKEDK